MSEDNFERLYGDYVGTNLIDGHFFQISFRTLRRR